jgi:hypothetical protein
MNRKKKDYSSKICFISAPPGYVHPQPMDTNSLGMVRSGKPMLSQQPTQQVPNRYPLNSYYSQPGPMSYPQQPQMPPAPHRSLSQNPTPNYSVAPSTMSSNGAVNKPNLIDSMELKSEDPFDDPSKLQVPQSQQQQQQQQQMFHPLLQSRSRPASASYYPNMPPTNNAYYPPPQRPITPSPDYNMSVGRGMRLPSAPTNAYGALPVQQRGYMPSSTNDLSAGMNTNNSIGLQSTPPPPLPPPSVTPH